MMTFDNAEEVRKCAAISKQIQLILRIVTDDRGSQCRLSSKFGAPRPKWRALLAAAKNHGIEVVGVSFHVGSGCRDASRYELALQDCREIFDIAKKDFGFDMKILDIGGGFPGETHSLWNPAEEIDEVAVAKVKGTHSDENAEDDHFMYFTEIAEQVAPVIDRLFPPCEGVRVIAEPGRYIVAASATLCCNVIAMRTNETNEEFDAEPIMDKEHAHRLSQMTREEETELVKGPSWDTSIRKLSISNKDEVLGNMVDKIRSYSQLYARQTLSQQETDVYNDSIDVYKEDFETAADILGVPTEAQIENANHTVEGMTYPLVAVEEETPDTLITLAAAGEAAVNGIVMQAVVDSAPLQDDIAYTVNNGVYSACKYA